MNNYVSKVEIAPIVRSLLNDQEIITVSVFARITDEIADTCIVAATPAAAALFGYTTPSEIEGRFVSTLHLLQDIKITRLRSAMRDREVRPCEDTYIMRILQKDGTIKPVLKNVMQVERDGLEIWVTRHKTINKNQGPPMPRKKIDPERLYDCWGSYSVAEANAILLAHRPAHTPQVGKKVTLTGGESCSTIGINNTSGRPDTQCLIDQEITDQMGIPYFSFDFQGGDTIAINLNGDPGIYLHECQQENCRKQFTSRQGNPQRCKYCGSRISREQNRANDESNRINNLR